MTANITENAIIIPENLTRANKLTVKVLSDGAMQADFYRTHKHLLTVFQADTTYQPDPNANKTLIREMFRQWMADHATEYGINFDPQNRQTAENTRMNKYLVDAAVLTDAEAMVQPDIQKFWGKLPDLLKVHLTESKVTMDSLTPKTTTSKGTDLSTMGIENGKYLSNGNWAWADIEGTVTLLTIKGEEIYVPLALELVSGQLKKFRMTQTQFNDAVKQELSGLGYTGLEPEKKGKAKAEKSAKADTQVEPEVKPEVQPEEKVEVPAEDKSTKGKGKGRTRRTRTTKKAAEKQVEG